MAYALAFLTFPALASFLAYVLTMNAYYGFQALFWL